MTDDILQGRRQRISIAEMLERAWARYERLGPREAYEAMQRGTLLIDTRDGDQRRRDGSIPGALVIDRTVLEWRVDPDSGSTHPAMNGLDTPMILLCQDGYSSSLAVASLLDLGATNVTNVAGGFQAWHDQGLPVRAPANNRSWPHDGSG
ncbi:MAG: rhodanese-like domain-containing protein [Actinomycetes bacterium]